MPDTRVILLNDQEQGTVLDGYLAVWGSAENPDLLHNYCTRRTDFGAWQPLPIIVDRFIGQRQIGTIEAVQADADGLWITSMRWLIEVPQLRHVLSLVGQHLMYWASEATQDDDNPIVFGVDGEIIRWPLKAAHLTPNPAQPPDRTWEGPPSRLTMYEEAFRKWVDENPDDARKVGL
jgi:hypothetical protein